MRSYFPTNKLFLTFIQVLTLPPVFVCVHLHMSPLQLDVHSLLDPINETHT